jgi:hypothetical protein
MSYINVAETGQFVTLKINADGVDYSSNVDVAFDGAGAANVVTVPALTEITLNATPGLFRWKQLDSLSEYVVTTASTNSLAATVVLDSTTFFTGANSTAGIFATTNNKTPTYFRMYWQGTTTSDKYVQGVGYLAGLAPVVTPDSPVWTSPLTIEVSGAFAEGTVA